MKRYIRKRDKKQEDLINLLVIAAPYYNVYMTDSNDYAEVNIFDEDVNKESEILDSIREKLPNDNEYKNSTLNSTDFYHFKVLLFIFQILWIFFIPNFV